MYPKESRTGINRYPHTQTLTQRRPTFRICISWSSPAVCPMCQMTCRRTEQSTALIARHFGRQGCICFFDFHSKRPADTVVLPAQCFPRLWNKTKPGQEALHALATQEADDAAASNQLSCCPAPAVSCSAATLVVAAALLLLRLLQLVATSFSQQIASKNTPPGRENIMALRDGMVPYNDNPQGLSSLLKPQLKNTNFQLLAALGSSWQLLAACPHGRPAALLLL